MRRSILRAFAVFAIAGIAACSGNPIGSVMPSSQSPQISSASDDSLGLGPENGYYAMTSPRAAVPVCPATADPRAWRCFAWIRTDLHPTFLKPNAIPLGVGYTPSEIQSAYGLNPSAGSGQTVIVIDAYGYKKAAQDLVQYRAAAGLPPCTTSSGCLKILNQNGLPGGLPSQPPKNSNNFGWVIEQSLDLDAVSAACPHCHIILIETPPSGLGSGITAATGLGHIISMSFGGSESGNRANPGLPMSGYAYVAAAGDSGGGLRSGGGPQVPCTWAAIVCAGGTKLTHVGSTWHSVVWNDEKLDLCNGPCGATGSGCSNIVPKPSWQTDTGCHRRSESDISADASVMTPLAVYNSNLSPAWAGIGGTSLSSPLIAAMFALAGNVSTRHAGMEIWQNHGSITNVTSGTNVLLRVTGPCASPVHYICVAGHGFNGPTGWGSPRGTSDL